MERDRLAGRVVGRDTGQIELVKEGRKDEEVWLQVS